MTLNELVKIANEKKLSTSDFLSLIGERAFELDEFEVRTLLRNAMWFINDTEENSNDFMTYLNDYEYGFWEGIMEEE